jgi:hypothetical protein
MMSGLFFLKNNEEAIDSRRDLAENGLLSVDFESRFSAVLSKLLKWLTVKSTSIEVPGTEATKRSRK